MHLPQMPAALPWLPYYMQPWQMPYCNKGRKSTQYDATYLLCGQNERKKDDTPKILSRSAYLYLRKHQPLERKGQERTKAGSLSPLKAG